jgi:hypothetical protein
MRGVMQVVGGGRLWNDFGQVIDRQPQGLWFTFE